MMCGGFGAVKEAGEETVNLCNEIKPHVEAHLNSTFETFEPVHYKSQVVNGTNYSIKVKVEDGKYVHVNVHKALPCYGGALTLSSATAGHTLESSI